MWDSTFGIKFTKHGPFIGKTSVSFDGDDIIIEGRSYEGTPELWALITEKTEQWLKTIEKNITKDDYENYCDICFDGVKLDRDRVFKTKFDMTSYIGDKLLGAIEPKDYQEQIFNNFGLLEWLTALYSSQIMRSKDSSINPITRNWFLIHQRQNVTREFGNMSTENGRHAIQYYLYYYSIYGEKLKLIFGDKINVVSDITENFFAGQEDRFCLHLLNWLDEEAGNIKKDNPMDVEEI